MRSNGYEEYKAILGFFGPFIYHLMYSFATIKSNLIVCQAKLAKEKSHKLVFPSQLDVKWLSNLKKEVLLIFLKVGLKYSKLLVKTQKYDILNLKDSSIIELSNY